MFPHEWQEPMNGDSGKSTYQPFFTVTTRKQAIQLIEQIEARGIECRIQGLVDCDQVCVHLNGNNEPASIYSVNQFLAWAPNFLSNY